MSSPDGFERIGSMLLNIESPHQVLIQKNAKAHYVEPHYASNGAPKC